MVTTTPTRTDEQIQRDVLNELEWDARLQPNEIGVAVKDGIVTLSGWVDSLVKKWAAEEAALRVRGRRRRRRRAPCRPVSRAPRRGPPRSSRRR